MGAEFLGICDTLVEVATRFPVPPRDLFAAVQDAWGHIDDRRLWRALSMVLEQGRLVRSGNFQSSGDNFSGYSLPVQTKRRTA